MLLNQIARIAMLATLSAVGASALAEDLVKDAYAVIIKTDVAYGQGRIGASGSAPHLRDLKADTYLHLNQGKPWWVARRSFWHLAALSCGDRRALRVLKNPVMTWPIDVVRSRMCLPQLDDVSREALWNTVFAASEDLVSAVSYVRSHASRLGVDPDRIAIGGFSAGGLAAVDAAYGMGARVKAETAWMPGYGHFYPVGAPEGQMGEGNVMSSRTSGYVLRDADVLPRQGRRKNVCRRATWSAMR